MLIKLTEAVHNTQTNSYSLKEITVNPSQIVAIREDEQSQNLVKEGRITEGLSPATQFSRVYIGGTQYGLNVLVVGSPDQIRKKLSESKTLIKG